MDEVAARNIRNRCSICGRVGAVGWLALAVLYGSACRDGGLFGPPAVVMAEAYAGQSGGATFDHAAYDRVVRRFVREGGWVDYQALAKDPKDLNAYIAALAQAPFDKLGRDEKLALLINAYNAFTLRLILDYYPLKSIRDIPASKRWEHRRWRIGPYTWSLNEIEHEQIRPKFAEPRVHFALVCAAVGCPPLRREAYTARRLEEQLEDQTRYVHGHGRWIRFDPQRGVVHLTKLYKWYGGDFTQVAGSVLAFASRYVPQLKAARASGHKIRTRWLDYDWSLNSKGNAR